MQSSLNAIKTAKMFTKFLDTKRYFNNQMSAMERRINSSAEGQESFCVVFYFLT